MEQRWVAQLAVFNFEVRYWPGRCNTAADALSRRQEQEDTEIVTEDAEYDGCEAIYNAIQVRMAVEPGLAMARPVTVELIEG